MNRLMWIKTQNGWSSGRYRIELAAPRIWVLTTMPAANDRAQASVKILSTAPSVRWLKSVATRLERDRARRVFMMRRLALVFASMTLLQVGISNDSVLVVPSGIALVYTSIRAVLSWIDESSDNAWARVSETYQ